jgi:hypothetical protein
LLRLLLVGVIVPAACASIDHALLSQLQTGGQSAAAILLLLATFIAQVGLLGVLCGRLIDQPLLRWIIYGWCWVLVDLQTVTAAALAGSSPYWGDIYRLLPSSLFNAQLGLMVIWAVLGTTRWYYRWPAALILGTLCLLPLLELHYHGSGITGFLFMQIVALVLICGGLRWRGFRLVDTAALAAQNQRGLRSLQFGVRHVLIWTTSLALVLGIARALDLFSPELVSSLLGERWLANITAGGLIAIVLVAALWAALGDGIWLRYAALLVLAPACGVLVALSEWNYSQTTWPARAPWAARPPPVLTALYWQGWFDNGWWLIAWSCLAGGLLFAALLIFRTLGYRLTRSAAPRPPT